MKKILIIQTAFIGDVVLATSLIEKLSEFLPEAKLDFLLRKGNESLLNNNPHIRNVLIWDKKNNKKRNLLSLIKNVRKEKYDIVINLQRFFATGLITALSGAEIKAGFDKNPLSKFFTIRIPHIIVGKKPLHETERNNNLIASFTDNIPAKPRLYPSEEDFKKVEKFTSIPYITISPTSVWFTKQYPASEWVKFVEQIPPDHKIFLLGGKDNYEACEDIIRKSSNYNVENLAGQLSFLQSAALMSSARLNYVNDSAPLHFASAMNAPVCAVFCSTIPGFGYYPLSDKSFIAQIDYDLKCRPCGLHGRKECPLIHFKCAYDIGAQKLLKAFYADR